MKIKVKLPKPRKEEPAPPPTDSPKPPSRLARMLALAHRIERRVESGELNDYAQAARTLGISRARMTQLINLLVLSPEIQEAVLLGKGQERAERSSSSRDSLVAGTGSSRERLKTASPQTTIPLPTTAPGRPLDLPDSRAPFFLGVSAVWGRVFPWIPGPRETRMSLE